MRLSEHFELPQTDIWHYLRSSHRPIVLYGMGNGADAIIAQLEKYSLAPSGVFASDGFVRGNSFHSMRVMSFYEAKRTFPDMIVLVSFGSQLPDVMKLMTSLDCEAYAPDVPVAGGEVFTLEFAQKHAAELETVFAMLYDELSKKTFTENVMFKLDGKMSHLIASETDKNEMMSLLALTDNEDYLDLGAYNGDTVLEFTHMAKSWRSITALEPDTRNFRKLLENTAHISDMLALNNAVSDKCETVMFSSSGGRKSRIGAGKPIEAVSVDSLGKSFSYIKADVEGAEKKMLDGAVNTIQSYKPKMLVSAYHKSEDIFALPIKIKEINPDYRVYLRHLPYIPAWDTNYIFV